MRLTKWIPFAALLSLLLVLSGCGASNAKWKEQVISALEKQKEINSYSFAGEARIKWGEPEDSGQSSPVSQSLAQLVTNGKWSWSGIASVNPLRLESELELASADSSAVMTLPLILNENHIYVNIPLINPKDEYFSLDLDALSEMSGGTGKLSQERLHNVMNIASQLSTRLFAALDEKWFAKADQPNANGHTVIEVNITEDNSQAITEALKEQWPLIIDDMKENGLLAEEQAAVWKQAAGEIKLGLGKLSVAVDNGGFIRELTIHTELGMGQEDPVRLIHVRQAYDRINEAPVFTKEIPEKTRPLTEVLKLMMNSSK